MTKAQDISDIIAQRQPLAKKLEEIETRLNRLCQWLGDLEQERQRQLKQWSGDSETTSKLQNLKLTEFEQRVRDELTTLHRLKGRFSRNTLNIGVIGSMGQGKSTLLQSLTGLTNQVIPAFPGKACTAARSKISHQDGQITEARIEFHSRDSFLNEVILPYYDKLGLEPKPSSFEAFASTPLPDLPSQEDHTQANIYNRLKNDYRRHTDQYREYLGRDGLRLQDESQISSYVAQTYEDNQLVNYQCLAVKSVEISCSFPVQEIGAIALIDVPGLGDFRLGDESLVIEALGQEVDFILFIYKPSKDRANFEQRDTQLYNLASQALNNLSRRSIFVLNADSNGQNQDSCRSLKQDLDSNAVRMPVLESVIADCSSPEEANTQVLETVLNHLRTNVTELDKAYAREKITSLESSLQSLQSDLEAAQSILPEIDSDEISEKYDEKFEEFWTTITNGLEKLNQDLIKNRDTPDENLKNKIQQVIASCHEDVKFPSLNEIEKLRNEKGAYADTYTAYLQDLRTSLSLKFLEIDKGLKKTIEGAKENVANVLINQCKIGGLTDARGSAFIANLAQEMPDDYVELKTGFQILAEFTLSYRGLIQHHIRLQLDKLTPDKAYPLKEGAGAQDILDNLETLYEETVYDCEQSLKDFFVKPSQASFAIVEEFSDRVLRAKTAKRDWRKFLRKKRHTIWSDFAKLQEQSQSIQGWVKQLHTVDTEVEELERAFQNL
jgi:energy-coupling factor transporter ATP-binding protein EcfA2